MGEEEQNSKGAYLRAQDLIFSCTFSHSMILELNLGCLTQDCFNSHNLLGIREDLQNKFSNTQRLLSSS